MSIPLIMDVIAAYLLILASAREPFTAQRDESVEMIDCIRESIPSQIYVTCCIREYNCTVPRQMIKGIECVGRQIAAVNDTMMDSRESGSSSDSSSSSMRWSPTDTFRRLYESCRRLPRARLQTCLRSELLRRCRSYSQERRGLQPRLYDRHTRPHSASALWESSHMSDAYPLQERSQLGGMGVGESYIYPRSYWPRGGYGMGSRGYSSSSSYGDMLDDDSDEFGYDSRGYSDSSYSRYK